MSLNDILKKISQAEKTELAKYEVELSLIDDFVKRDKEILAENNKAFTLLDNTILETKTILNISESVDAGIKVLLENISKYEIKVKELGLVLPKEITTMISLLKAKEKNNLKRINGITKALQGLDSAHRL